MTDSTIFTADNATTEASEQAAIQAVQTNTATQQQTEFVAAIVGDGKKYKTVDDLAKAYVNADTFIEQLKAENRELKEKVTAAKTVDDVLERLQQQTVTHSDDSQSKPSGVGVADLTKLVEATVTGLETQKQRRENMLKADALMKEAFGEKAGQKFAEVAVTPELQKVYTDLAAADPIKFVSLFTGADAKPSTTTADTGGVNTTVSYSSTNQSSRVNQQGTKEYYDNVRRTKPALYYSQDFQLSMDKTVRENPNLYYGKR
jgi:hypothetical protein